MYIDRNQPQTENAYYRIYADRKTGDDNFLYFVYNYKSEKDGFYTYFMDQMIERHKNIVRKLNSEL